MNEQPNSILDTIEAALYHAREDAWMGGPIPSELVKIHAALTWLREQREAQGEKGCSDEQRASGSAVER